jgi:hypothetical protein
MWSRRLCAACLALLVGLAIAAIADGAPRERRVPNLVGRTRTHAESLLAKRGFEYLLPTPFAARYEVITTGPPEVAVPERSAPDRRVVGQDPAAGGSADLGDTIDFATVLPPKAGKGDAAPFPMHVNRTAVAGDQRHVALHFRAMARRCLALDHVDVGIARRYVTVVPSLTSTIRSETRCNRLVKRVVYLELPRRVRDRIVVDSVPSRPTRGLYDVAPSRYDGAQGAASARAVAVNFIHSSDCGLLAGTRVRETRHKVTITLLTGNLGNTGICLANAIEDMVVVPLRHRLGERRIVDGARKR